MCKEIHSQLVAYFARYPPNLETESRVLMKQRKRVFRVTKTGKPSKYGPLHLDSHRSNGTSSFGGI